ncbi:MAG TPA: ribonuclease Y [Candidatus Kerfeldbacteria bacterium]|nr:MAG: Ribonuclease Y [Parcubacteria group bacterium GW2011_GWC2_49_9]HCJ52984.1 ribonuclease Y [Candidatus Kerfeldbacteria bacterium]
MSAENLIWVILTFVGIPGGMITGYFARKVWAAKQIDTAEARLQQLTQETNNKQKEILLKAKDQALQIVEDAKREERIRRTEITQLQSRLEKREGLFDQKLIDLENRQQKLQDRATEIEAIKGQIEKIRQDQTDKLERISGLSREEAKNILLENVETSVKDDLFQRVKHLEKTGLEEYERKAREIMSSAMQRYAASHAAETTTTVINLPSDEMKGRIIGREGRNIKTIEQLTGVEIIVDDTPESILVSGFSPIRRHLAKRALEKLIQDGRIHPGRIEEAIDQAKKELARDIREAGEEAAYEVGIAGIDPKLLQILGRLKYRTSYGQNQLRHSIEVAHISSMLAEELGANVSIAKKGGLFHDIGKAVDHEIQGSHTEIGYDILKRKFGFPEEIAYICIGHHEDQPKTIEAVIVKVADALSGARPGARKDTYEQYVKRLEDLEAIAKSFDGVEKTYAIQAGREVRVFVTPEKIDDWTATKMAKDIATKIQQELKYPGEIKVTVIREKRVIEYAR